MKRTILIWSIIYAILSTVIGLLYYFQIAGLLVMFLLSVAILVGCVIAGILMFRKTNGGYSEFRENFKIMGFIMLIGVVLSGIFQQGYMVILSEEKIQELKDRMVDAQIASYESMGLTVSPEQEEQLIDQVEASFSLKGFLMGLPIMLLVYGVIGFILCLIMRKEPPTANPSI